MKTTLSICLSVLMLTGCMSSRQAFVNTYVGDYTKYLEEGVAVYPVPPSETGHKEYLPVAEICVEAGYGLDKNGNIFDPTPSFMLDRLVAIAKKKGANGLFNVKISSKQDSKEEYSNRCTATGFAVKLKNFPRE